MAKDTIRWLHLSDFHVGKDNYGQIKLFRDILRAVREKVKAGLGPDMTFITGDIANKGDPKEYKLFNEEFFLPLLAELGGSKNIFLIPGNHDVDRNKSRLAARYDAESIIDHFFDATKEGAEHRKDLLPRFDAYTKAAMWNSIPVKSSWLSSPSGTYTYTLTIREHPIGVLGLNTAWLSMGDEDRHRMTPGKSLVEEGLETLEKELTRLKGNYTKIVLGHHPIDWFSDEQVEPIRSLFGRHNIIYLHGHLHKISGRHEEGGGHQFLSIQTGASFQAREDSKWVNQILWSELDYTRKLIKVEPLKWSKDNQSWVSNTEAFPPSYRESNKLYWYLRLPQSSQEPMLDIIDEAVPELPREWIYINKQFLAEECKKLEDEQIIRFFDGSYPSWQIVLSPNIKTLSIVESLQNVLEKARLKAGPGVTVLTGPGGEGKTTVLKQVICNLVKSSTAWKVLWRDDEDADEPLDFIQALPQDEGITWLIVSDEASNIADKTFATVKLLYKQGRKDIQILLCCRDTDWIRAKADSLKWASFTMHYTKEIVDGSLTEKDAKKVVETWSRYGDQGLRALVNISFDKAVSRLLKAARANSPSEGGSFLGAMLDVRFGEGLKEHVKEILERLEKVESPGGTLLEAFAYVAALHAKGAELLTKEILAKRLDCAPDQIKQRVIGPLGREAPISRSGQYILTRHSRIAQAAVEILEKPPFHYDIEEKYIIDLVRDVIRAHKLNAIAYKNDIAKWRYLSSDIFNLRSKNNDRYSDEQKYNENLGIRLARALAEEDPADGYYLVNLAQMLWRAGKPEQGAKLFRTANEKVRKDRAYYFAWGVAEGRAGNHAVDAWLAGVSLADATEKGMPDNERIKKSLAGLATAFKKLFERANDDIFIKACAGAVELGLSLDLDIKTIANLQKMQEECKKKGIQNMSLSVAFHWLQEGIQISWQQREVKLEGPMRGDQLAFQKLAQRLGL